MEIMLDRERLIKLMMMTTSTNDAEAVAAVRKANSLLASEKTNWSDFINGVPSPRPAPPPRPPMRPAGRGTSEAAARHDRPQSRFTDKEIPRMLSSLLRDSKGGFRDFVESINDHWCNKGYLTERQYEAVVNAYERMQ